MSIRGILFDKDGTLLDFNRTWVPVYRIAARIVSAGDADLATTLLAAGGQDDMVGTVAPGSPLAAGTAAEVAALWAPLAPAHGFADLAAALDEIFLRESAKSAAAVPGLVDTLCRLQGRGLALGLATSDSEAGARATLAPLGVLEQFSFIAGYDSGFGCKPDAGMVLGFCSAASLDPGEVLVVGDNRHDLDMARAAGAGLAVGVLTGTSAAADLAPFADHVVDSIADIDGLL